MKGAKILMLDFNFLGDKLSMSVILATILTIFFAILLLMLTVFLALECIICFKRIRQEKGYDNAYFKLMNLASSFEPDTREHFALAYVAYNIQNDINPDKFKEDLYQLMPTGYKE